MKVLAVLPYYVPEGGGLEGYAHEVLKRLVEGGHDVTAVACTRNAPGPRVHDGVQVLRVKPLLFLSNTPVHARLPFRLARLARDADVLWAHGPVPGPIEAAGLASRMTGAPLAVTYHAGALTSVSLWGRAAAAVDARTLERWALKRATRIATVSEFVRDRKLAPYRAKTQVVPPGVDLETFRPVTEGSTPAVFAAAPLSDAYRWKGVDVLLHAFARLPAGELWIAGDGPRRGALAERARRLGVGNRVQFLGKLPRNVFVEKMARARVVCLPSTTDAESFGMLLAEANACSVPVIGSKVGGIPSFVRDGENGLLVPPRDATALAEALRALLDDEGKAREMGRRGRAIVQRHHRWDDVAARMERLLEGAC